MDSLNLYEIKAEKANAMLIRHSQLRRLANLLRLVEALVVLVLVSRLSLTIPHAVKNSGGLLRDLSAVLFGPRFVFVIGNLIVVVLFAKSGQFSPKKKLPLHDDLYDEFLRRSGEKKATADHSHNNKVVSRSTFGRSKSEVFSPAGRAKRSSRVLRRSETEKFGNIDGEYCKVVSDQNQKSGGDNGNDHEIVKVEEDVDTKKKKKQCLYPEDLMSGEEFRLKVEAFIARQQRFRSMEEEFSSDDLE